MTTATDSILNTLREVSDYLKDRLDYDMRGDPPRYIGNEEAHLYGEVQEAMKELERAGQRERALVEALEAATDLMRFLRAPLGHVDGYTSKGWEASLDRWEEASATLVAAYGEKP